MVLGVPIFKHFRVVSHTKQEEVGLGDGAV